ncbi:MAG: STAS domain-containing protein [Planctomycetes bacterium]|nr:STAS domain-containing protein [Planctomycetota bacterium]
MSAPSPAPEVVIDGKVTVMILGVGFKIIDERLLETGFGETLIGVASKAEPPLVVLDLTEVQFFGSSFIEILFQIWSRLHARSGRFGICGLCAHCEDVLKIAHLDTLWPLFATRPEAVADLSQERA